jgi:hypothetical protein
VNGPHDGRSVGTYDLVITTLAFFFLPTCTPCSLIGLTAVSQMIDIDNRTSKYLDGTSSPDDTWTRFFGRALIVLKPSRGAVQRCEWVEIRIHLPPFDLVDKGREFGTAFVADEINSMCKRSSRRMGQFVPIAVKVQSTLG